ncbi:helix-turn-helix domain-containing protein [Paenibacillus protaetiae]|uniref:AraC family transcriptional regulator n=1 Tax=Paenibacillus protaetiae TaxID=2509456 RepID=A0A4P6EZ04_9BACL|nr:AraC family transcriptional regulator [Paenibacillus protaetiae]QAY68096.1 AraC family transcriptional regulator [Paenibacillus protaetiae]
MEPSLTNYFLQNQIDHFQAEVTMAMYIELNRDIADFLNEHSFYRLFYVQQGEGSIAIGDAIFEVAPGTMYLVPAGVHFALNVSQHFQCYTCHFRSEQWDMPLINRMEIPYVSVIDDRQAVKALYDKMVATHHSRSVTRNLKLRGQLNELFAVYLDSCFQQAAVPQSETEAEQNWNAVLAYIDSHLDRPILVEELAKLACLHPNYFITLFKETMGCSPIQFVTTRRISAAKQLLAATKLPVSDIAGQVGMQNHYLSRQFKRMIGLTPLQYRKLMQAEELRSRPEGQLKEYIG